jgi:hypothetical protein
MPRITTLRAGDWWQGQESSRWLIAGHRSDDRSVGLSHPQTARTDNPTEPSQPRTPSKQSAVQALKSVSVTGHLGHSGVTICYVSLA